MVRILVLFFACFLAAGCQNRTVSADGGIRSGVSDNEAAGNSFVFDFGAIPDNRMVSHTFTFVNQGERIMHITGKTNSCGCTKSEMDTDVLMPGGKAELRVKFNPTGYGGTSVEQFVYLNTDDPDHSVYKFTIKADVKR